MTATAENVYEIHPRKDNRGVDLISDALPFGKLWYAEPNAVNDRATVTECPTRLPL